MMNITKAGSYNTWKCTIGLPALLSAVLFLSSTNAIAQSKTASVQVKQNEPKKGEADYILEDLIALKIVSGKESSLSFKLNYEELVVNSKAMPEDVHKKFKEKYLGGNPRKTITYKMSKD